MLFTQLQEAGIQLSKDQLAVLADTGEIINFGPGAFTVTTNALFQADGVEVYDSDCDDVPNAQPSFMANISSYGLDAFAEVHNLDNVDNNMINQGVQVKPCSKQSSVVNHSETEITSDSNIIPYSQYKAQQLEPKLYDGNVIKNTSAIMIPDSEETLMLAEESHSKMLLKQQDPMMLKNKVNTTPVHYNSMNSSDPSPSCRPTKFKVLKELPKVMVNTSLKKLKHHLAGFDVVVKERTMATAITKGLAKVVKCIKMKEWKPTSKMFKNVGYKWVPTGRNLTIVGTKCPLTRFTSTKIVHPRIPDKSTVITNKKPSSASQWRPKETNHASSSSAPKIIESKTANHFKPNNHMRSNVSISLCSSSVKCRSYKSYLERFDTSVVNLVKEILLKLNLPDHRILKDGGEGIRVCSGFSRRDTTYHVALATMRGEEVISAKDDKKGKSDTKCFRCGEPNHLIDECPKPPQNKDQKAFVGVSWSDSENEAEDKTNEETCLMAQS
nr:alpha/beta hydrolases superfamily protein [Tanacetum cinerariifolium]